MAEERAQRHLAAILAADVVGYSRLMGRDEAGTLATLKGLRAELFGPKTRQYGGRIFKIAGDSALAEFPSAVDAVLASLEIQRALAARNAALPEERHIVLRIGISLGDVIADGTDLYGNGVNIAARLQTLSEPGGICVAANVLEHLHAAVDFGFEDMGEQEVKNIERPVHAYRIAAASGKAPPALAPRAEAPAKRPAVAVLPFDNLTRDPEQEYFSDGLTEDIITALSQWRVFPVIARNSVFTYKGRAVKVQQVAQELGAKYVIEGSVRKGGDRVRVTVQLIDAESGHHVWAERYDRRLDDIFALQDEITERIAATVAPELERAERQRANAKPPSDLQAWDLYLRGMAFLQEFSKEGNQRGREMFERAVALDPNYARGYTGLAYSHHRDAFFAVVDDPAPSVAKCIEAARRALSLDDTDAFAHFVLSRGLHLAGRIEQALLEAQRSVELNPNDPLGPASLGALLVSAGRHDEAVAALQRALQLAPKDPRAYMFLAMQGSGHFVAGRHQEAAALAKESLDRRGGYPDAEVLLIASLAIGGHVEEARRVLTQAAPIEAAQLARQWVIQYLPPADRARLLDGLRQAGWAG